MNAPVKAQTALMREAGGVFARVVSMPCAGADEVVVAPSAVGICGTDLQMLRGLRSDPAPIIGHEGVGTVVEAGPVACERFPVGKRVLFNPTHPARPDLLLGHSIDGLLQQRVLVGAASLEGGQLLACPDGMPDALAPLAEPLAAGLLSLETLRAALGRVPRRLAIFGGGIVGHLTRIVAEDVAPVPDLVHIHRSAETITWGEVHGFAPERSIVIEEAATDIGGFDAAIIATPRNATLSCLDHALAKLTDGGAISLVAGIAPEERSCILPDVDLAAARTLNTCGLGRPAFVDCVRKDGVSLRLTGQRGVSAAFLDHAARMIAANGARFTSLVTRPVGLSEAARLLSHYARTGARLHNGRRFMKLVVDPRSP